MNITSIKKQSNSKYKIIFSDNSSISLYDNVILNNGLLYRKSIDDELMNKITIENNYYEIYNKVVKLINTRLRSKKEVNDYLDKLEITDYDKDKIINTLIDNGLINDLVFTHAFISDKIYLSLDGPSKIKNSLSKLGIEESIINDELEKVDDNIFHDKLNRIISKKIKNNHKYSDYILKNKIMTEMINLGYYKDDILDILNNYKIDNSNLIKKDYDKLYNKYSKKLSGTELNYKIKQGLFTKGYNIEDINEVISD